MLFNSYEFIFLFLPVTFIGFFAFARFVGKKAATFWIVTASFFFYGWWDIRYLPLLFCSICFNYIIGLFIERYCRQCKLFLFIGVLGNLVLLGYFKYTGFFLQTINDEDNMHRYEEYRKRAEETCPHLILGGRLGTYRYYNMDQIIEQALEAVRQERE